MRVIEGERSVISRLAEALTAQCAWPVWSPVTHVVRVAVDAAGAEGVDLLGRLVTVRAVVLDGGEARLDDAQLAAVVDGAVRLPTEPADPAMIAARRILSEQTRRTEAVPAVLAGVVSAGVDIDEAAVATVAVGGVAAHDELMLCRHLRTLWGQAATSECLAAAAGLVQVAFPAHMRSLLTMPLAVALIEATTPNVANPEAVVWALAHAGGLVVHGAGFDASVAIRRGRLLELASVMPEGGPYLAPVDEADATVSVIAKPKWRRRRFPDGVARGTAARLEASEFNEPISEKLWRRLFPFIAGVPPFNADPASDPVVQLHDAFVADGFIRIVDGAVRLDRARLAEFARVEEIGAGYSAIENRAFACFGHIPGFTDALRPTS